MEWKSLEAVTPTDGLTVTERLSRLLGHQKIEDIFQNYRWLKSLPEINEDAKHSKRQPWELLSKAGEVFKELVEKRFRDEAARKYITKLVYDFFVETPECHAAILLRKQQGDWKRNDPDDYLVDRLWTLVMGISTADYKNTFDVDYRDEVIVQCMSENGVFMSKPELNRRLDALKTSNGRRRIKLILRVARVLNTSIKRPANPSIRRPSEYACFVAQVRKVRPLDSLCDSVEGWPSMSATDNDDLSFRKGSLESLPGPSIG